MNSRKSFLALCAIPIVLSISSAAAQDDLVTLVDDSLKAMKAGKWEEGLDLNTRAIKGYGANNPLQIHGPKFGEIYYRKGLCEMKLRKWDEAIKSFEICYRDFPNREGARSINSLNKMALLRWAEAAMSAGQYEEALKLFQKFLSERDKAKDQYAQGLFHTAMAICHYGLGRIPEGNEHFQIAINNRRTFPTPDDAIMPAFQQLANAAISKKNEQALLDFIEKNRGELIGYPHQMHSYSNLFLKLGAEAISANMNRAALCFYQFVPPTESAINDLRTQIKLMGPLERATYSGNVTQRKELQAQLAALEETWRGKLSPEMTLLSATAYIHEKNGNFRGAYAAYLQLETYYQNSEKREDNLYNLIRTSTLAGAAKDLQRYADSFISSYPNSRHVPTIRKLMLSSIFYDGQYETCIEIAKPVLPSLEPGSAEHDMYLHVLGGSYFYTGEFEKAQPLLDEHVEKYPQSMFALSAAYFRASNYSRLGDYAKSATLLDEFLKAHSDPVKNIYMPFALYDRAICHYNLDEHEPTLEVIARIIRDFPNAVIIDQAYLLRGNTEESLKNADRAELAYKAAYDTAVKNNRDSVAGDALHALIVLLGEPKSDRLKDAVPFAETFWEKHATGSRFRARVAMAQFAPMAAVGKDEEALERLRQIIVETSNNEESTELEGLINHYTEAYLTKHTAQELKDHYYNFPGIRTQDSTARALLRVYVIRVYEGLIRKTKEEEERQRLQATIKALFQELKKDFALKDLTSKTLVKVGDYLRRNTATPREAIAYYDEVLSRNDKKERIPALLGRAEAYGTSGAVSDIEKGIADYETIYNESTNKNEDEIAYYNIIRLLAAKKDYAKAAEKAQLYLDPKKSEFSRPKFTSEVGMILAKTFDDRKMVDDAIAMYGKIYGSNAGRIRISAPAVTRWMELLWARNQKSSDPAIPSDRQGAYVGGAKYIESTKGFKDKMTEDDLKLWLEVERLVETYVANPEIKSLEELKREKEAARR